MNAQAIVNTVLLLSPMAIFKIIFEVTGDSVFSIMVTTIAGILAFILVYESCLPKSSKN